MRDLYPSGAGLEGGEGYLRALQWHRSHPRIKPNIFVDDSKSSTPSAHVVSGLTPECFEKLILLDQAVPSVSGGNGTFWVS